MPNKRRVKKVKTGFRTKSKTVTRKDGTSVVKENISAKTLDRPFKGKVKSRIVYNPDGSIKRGRYKGTGPNPDGTTGTFKVKTTKDGITTGTTTNSDGTGSSKSIKDYKPRTGNDAAPYAQNDFKKVGGAMVADRNKNGVLEGWEKAIDKKIKASMNAKAKYGYAMEGMNMASKGRIMKAKDNRRIRLTRKNK